MPELPEVETYKKYFDGTALHQKIINFECVDERLLKKPISDIKEALIDTYFKKTIRIGKYLFIKLDDREEQALVMHFGMTGRLSYYKDQEDRPKYGHIVFQFDSGFFLAFENKRKFGWLDLADSIGSYQEDKKLSDDARDLSWEQFKDSLSNRKTYIKPILMDQSVAAGVGNWMADEILYQAKIHPESKVEDMSEKQVKSVYDSMKKVIEVAIENDAVYRDFPEDFLIHNRKTDGECHHTGKKIQKIKVGGRSTYYCPEWQQLID